MSLEPVVRERIQALLDANRVVLFMKGEPRAPQCGFSAKAAGTLDALGVEFTHVDVLSDPEIREGIKAYGQWPTIPQLYIGGELVGGSDIIEQMTSSGELHAALGVPAPDRTPPEVTITPPAAKMLRESIAGAGEGYALQVTVDPQFNARLQLAPTDARAIATEAEGIRVQFDLASVPRARGLKIDWADDMRGRGLVIENPNAPPKVRDIAPDEVAARVRAGTLVLVDVRPADERALVAAPVEARTLDDDGLAALELLPRDTALAFLCHHGNRSGQAAEHFRRSGFAEVYNVAGGIEAWADADPAIGRY
jgi:monothiol glutaredoxin